MTDFYDVDLNIPLLFNNFELFEFHAQFRAEHEYDSRYSKLQSQVTQYRSVLTETVS